MRTIDVEGLGWEAIVVEIENETLLLIDAGLSDVDRVAVLNRALAEV